MRRAALVLAVTALLAGPVVAAPAGADADAVEVSLNTGERRVMLLRHVERAYATPDDALDVAQLGSRTLVLTARRPGRVELHVRCEGHDWVKALTVRGPEVATAPVPAAAAPASDPVPAPPRVAAPAVAPQATSVLGAPPAPHPKRRRAVARPAPPADDEEDEQAPVNTLPLVPLSTPHPEVPSYYEARAKADADIPVGAVKLLSFDRKQPSTPYRPELNCDVLPR